MKVNTIEWRLKQRERESGMYCVCVWACGHLCVTGSSKLCEVVIDDSVCIVHWNRRCSLLHGANCASTCTFEPQITTINSSTVLFYFFFLSFVSFAPFAFWLWFGLGWLQTNDCARLSASLFRCRQTDLSAYDFIHGRYNWMSFDDSGRAMAICGHCWQNVGPHHLTKIGNVAN